MEIIKNTLDDLLFETYTKLLAQPFSNNAKRTGERGPFSEIFGALLELENPRARLSRSDARGKIFSAIGELMWYFSKSDDLSFIEYYISAYRKESEDGKTVYGGYGPRLFNSCDKHNQIENIISLLTKNSTSKKAVIQIFEPRDIEYELTDKKASIPCTCSLHFLQRDGKLNLMTQMRSNDVHLGLPHDIFAFTMLQEYIANRLNLELGTYKHSVASLHLYESAKAEAEAYLQEGHQSTTKFMPPMPKGDQTNAIQVLLELEQKIRNAESFNLSQYNLDPYWLQMVHLLMFFKADKPSRDLKQMENVRKFVTDENYSYILDRKIRNAQISKN